MSGLARNGGRGMLIEGYASLFGIEDLSGDVVRAGAFAASLRRAVPTPMLMEHRPGRVAGRWSAVREDGRGLFVRGFVAPDAPAGREALARIGGGMTGLSIGYVALQWSTRLGRGRVLKAIELKEISLVSAPMLPQARFAPIGADPFAGR
jgi:uncharacterized protein